MDVEKKRPWSSRLSFFRTKRAIFTLTLLVIVSVVLIALGATHVLRPDSKHDSDNNNNNDNNDNNNSSLGDDQQLSDINTTADGIMSAIGTWKPDNSSSIAEGVPLRIMSLGASLVRGEFSTDSNGFRLTMRDQLVALGASVNMVGSQRFGEMLDNDLEAYGGNRVSQTYEHAINIVPQLQPNVFLIQSGTNNVLQNRDVDKAGADIEKLIDYLLKTSPRSTVIFSTCLTNTVADCEPKILDVNQQYRELIKKYKSKPVLLAEMHPSEGFPDRPQVADIGEDGTHPTDHGYDLMGYIFTKGIQEADRKGYLRWPLENGLERDGDAGRADATTTTEELPPATSTASIGTTKTSTTIASVATS
ncbi:carbohydrate esterase family 3 protein [Annulohypoxylon maeteangense]|uniref:carbohydrate esterase family 3 protein n=1 Tax=Annulohypoxylon maeteangense TaxID=1927788 RepID=UPI0020079AE7|nr:carbohydrate esterase family 3 protein [Annulohypoxylon maeteangense]KAI0885065.1 carbohydrate esterase family 3 protein [Annulohypoxylon maeteangense]